jgi:tRNA(Ile)-lysidine synthase
MKFFNNLLDKTKEYTFLVSGGVDSIASCHWLSQRTRLKIKVLHFNHNWQPANKQMEDSVRDFCDTHSLPFQAITRQVEQSMGKQTENDFRQWRLAYMAEQTGHTNYVTAHNLGDCVEQYFMNFLKGCPEYKPIQEKTEFSNFTIFHPFLLTTKEQMVEWARKNDLTKWVVVDPTNNDLKYQRNWVRHQMLPLIAERTNLETVVRRKFYQKKIL